MRGGDGLWDVSLPSSRNGLWDMSRPSSRWPASKNKPLSFTSAPASWVLASIVAGSQTCFWLCYYGYIFFIIKQLWKKTTPNVPLIRWPPLVFIYFLTLIKILSCWSQHNLILTQVCWWRCPRLHRDCTDILSTTAASTAKNEKLPLP